ncbi:MAG TPA: metallophosphoesterase [Candidatus Margulisiibacteriota bacterium]|nr:metallophosphoesterase [Candidatus Margulisiibacteriota bacterium]
MRRIFIGDIQGCLHQLDEILAALTLRPGDRLYSVGDLVNRGPDSLGVLRRLRALDAQVVLGNHDLHLLRIVAGRTAPRTDDCLAAVLAAADRDDLLGWLGAQPVMRVEDDVVVVHAGLHPLWTDLHSTAAHLNAAIVDHVRHRRDRDIRFATEVRFCDPEGRRPPTDDPPPGPPYAPWDHFYQGERTVVFGHWARRGLVVAPRRRGLDTGCVYGGALTAWIAEEDRFVHTLPRRL